MEVITGYTFPGFNWFETYQIVCITNEKPNHIKCKALSEVSGYPVGFV
jgi:hypothetical protein